MLSDDQQQAVIALTAQFQNAMTAALTSLDLGPLGFVFAEATKACLVNMAVQTAAAIGQPPATWPELLELAQRQPPGGIIPVPVKAEHVIGVAEELERTRRGRAETN